MPNETTNYQCPACTGPLRFDSATGKLVCDYCGSTYEVKEVEALYADKQKASDTAARQRPQGPVWGRGGSRRPHQPHLLFLRGRAGLRRYHCCHHLPLTAATPRCWAGSSPAS